MRIALLVVGLVLTGIVCLQSMTILTTPFITPVYREAAAVGMLMTIALALGAGFGLTNPKVSMGAFAVAALIGWVAGRTTPYHDLNVWAFVAMGLAVLALAASRAKGRGEPAMSLNVATGQVAPLATPPAVNPKPTSNAMAAPLAGESTLVADLERLGRLHAAKGLSDEEFVTLKAQLISQAAN